MKWKGRILIAIFLLLSVGGASASEIIWLSNAPPKKISK
jgi:hypothetical protein